MTTKAEIVTKLSDSIGELIAAVPPPRVSVAEHRLRYLEEQIHRAMSEN